MIPIINMAATGQNITALRKNAGLTVKALQSIFGFSTPQAIYKWQQGVAMPSLDNLIVLSPDQLLITGGGRLFIYADSIVWIW